MQTINKEAAEITKKALARGDISPADVAAGVIDARRLICRSGGHDKFYTGLVTRIAVGGSERYVFSVNYGSNQGPTQPILNVKTSQSLHEAIDGMATKLAQKYNREYQVWSEKDGPRRSLVIPSGGIAPEVVPTAPKPRPLVAHSMAGVAIGI